ncbi:GNAT family N-acetyltransferase [Kosakonia sp.]|uniref:GNAT family N-acetyltransferase n=1 Tax=Kosakonia sp. TaxID=1916651 RepID=UPI0028ACD7B5|nr:GNAT family N-acetyltransferase [Kosakonia sp.]
MLAELRVEAMRPSLEAINRFDPIRARERFLSTFTDKETFIICYQHEIVGFYVLRDFPTYLYLDHFYIKNQFQGKGVGKEVVQRIQQKARHPGKAIRLIALKASPANDFYRALGFMFERAEGVDNHYIWPCVDAE